MTIKKLHFLLIALAAVAITACEKEPSTSHLNRDYLVYTASDPATDFAGFESYFLPDSILLIGTSDKAEYWKDADAQLIIQTLANNMDERGFTRTDDREAADLGLQLSYVRSITYFVGYDNPYWWWYYPYYWSPGYWGDWLGWYYPFPVAYYAYTAGSMITEMVDLTATPQADKKLPVVWDSFIGGLLTNSHEVNLERMLEAVNQAFVQSPNVKR